jgi:hypothetical protein
VQNSPTFRCKYLLGDINDSNYASKLPTCFGDINASNNLHAATPNTGACYRDINASNHTANTHAFFGDINASTKLTYVLYSSVCVPDKFRTCRRDIKVNIVLHAVILRNRYRDIKASGMTHLLKG